MIALFFHLLSPKRGDLLPEVDLSSLVRPVVLSLRVCLEGFNIRASVLGSCATLDIPLLSTAGPVGRPHGLLGLGD